MILSLARDKVFRFARATSALVPSVTEDPAQRLGVLAVCGPRRADLGAVLFNQRPERLK
jgi:hypothetical protein